MGHGVKVGCKFNAFLWLESIGRLCLTHNYSRMMMLMILYLLVFQRFNDYGTGMDGMSNEAVALT